MRHAIHSPLAAGCLILALAVAPLAGAAKTDAPSVAQQHVRAGDTQTLNPQPIPPGRSATARKTSKPGQQQAIIFVGGKKPASRKVDAGHAAPTPGSAKARTQAPSPHIAPPPCPVNQICLP